MIFFSFLRAGFAYLSAGFGGLSAGFAHLSAGFGDLSAGSLTLQLHNYCATIASLPATPSQRTPPY